MAKRITTVVLRLVWDDDPDSGTDHPAGWNWRELVWGNPFSREGTREATLLDFEDVESNALPTKEEHP